MRVGEGRGGFVGQRGWDCRWFRVGRREREGRSSITRDRVRV